MLCEFQVNLKLKVGAAVKGNCVLNSAVVFGQRSLNRFVYLQVYYSNMEAFLHASRDNTP
jgi:hypothetical protein